jgi:hypothetical protein
LFDCKKAVLELLPYSADNLALSLVNRYTPKTVIESKNHFIYLNGYLSHPDINAQIILVEDNYINKDYLHDYAHYYSLCFQDYPKICKRIHFFSTLFTVKEFEAIITGKKEDHTEFWKTYLGFIVVKPIPEKIIGYTVLKTFAGGRDFDSRNFWGLRPYTVHLFGNKIEYDYR